MGLLWTEKDLSDGPLRKKLQQNVKIKLPEMNCSTFDISKDDVKKFLKFGLGVDLVSAMSVLGELSKEAPIVWNWNLQSNPARVCVDLNISESMRSNISDGSVATSLAIGLAWARLFGNNDLDVVAFSTYSIVLPKYNFQNMRDYVSTYISGNCGVPCAEYGLAIVDNIQEYFVNQSIDKPVLCFVLTDGYSINLNNIKRALQESARYKIFYQFVCLGGSVFPERYLTRLRKYQKENQDVPCNIGFVGFESISGMNSYKVFKDILQQYHEWLKSVQCD